MSMARFEHKQLEQKSCGASAIMCTVKEFSLPMNWDDANADRIYRNIQKGIHDESLMSKMVAELKKHGLKVQLIEDEDRTGVFKSLPAFSGPYSDYRSDVASAALTIETRKSPDPFKADDFKDSARILLVVIIVGQNLTHWVLARREGGKYYVMNPDPGKNAEMPDLLTWMNGAATDVKDVCGVKYMFAGIILRVIK
jgi:hypothetical protein